MRTTSILLTVLALTVQTAWAQRADNRSILGAGNEYLAAGSYALLAGNYEEGIRLTELGLKAYSPRTEDRATALSNLCAAHAALNRPDVAIQYCSESLALNSHNWRAFNNRSYAYTLKNMYSEALFDIDAAAALNPDARQVRRIKGMINEHTLQPRIIIEDHH